MSTAPEEDLSRVTIISSSRRVDLALPGSVTLSELLPSIIRFSGLEANVPTDAVSSWVLQRFGSDPFDLYTPVERLGIRDGETLHLRHRESALPDAAFDDVVDAVGGATASRPSWAPRHSQRVGLALVWTVLIGLPLLMILAQPTIDPDLARVDPSTRIPLALAIGFAAFLSFAACIAGIAIARAARETITATTLAWASVTLAGITGWFLPDPISGGDIPLAVRLIFAASLVLLASTASALAAKVTPMALFSVALTALFALLGAGFMIIWAGHNVEVAAVTMTVMAFVTAFLPTLSYRIAGIALPNLPVTTEAILSDETPVQSDIVDRAILADRLLGAMLTATSATAVLASVLVLTDRSIWALLLVLCIGAAFLLRARAFVGFTQRLALLLGGGISVVLASASAAVSGVGSVLGMGLLALCCLLIAYTFAHYSATIFNKVLAPTWGRWGDVFEWLAIIGIVPALLGVLNLYNYFSALL